MLPWIVAWAAKYPRVDLLIRTGRRSGDVDQRDFGLKGHRTPDAMVRGQVGHDPQHLLPIAEGREVVFRRTPSVTFVTAHAHRQPEGNTAAVSTARVGLVDGELGAQQVCTAGVAVFARIATRHGDRPDNRSEHSNGDRLGR